ncbi:MAG: M23 family metallopeptidase [Candidatus Puniceispirillales bacterium]|jgi:murein DD-endopeptidase MepM/ murein hydrolase activator NlpD|tara:strand:- start:578 stop:1438 length:861 start_codon:yes stop_codon:yes gene_type:complete
MYNKSFTNKFFNNIFIIFIIFIITEKSFAKETLILKYDNIIVNLQGNFIQGGLVKGNIFPNKVIKFENKILLKDTNGKFVFGFGRDYKEDSYLEVKISEKKWLKKSFKIKKQTYNTQYINGLQKKMVTPPKSFYDRIKKENKSIKLIRNLNTEVNFIFQEFILPTKGIVTGVFGSQRILNGKPRRPHYGIDIAASKGTSVIAPIDSIVRMAEKDLYFTGGTIILDHGHGVTSVYSHLSLININVGDKVIKGQKIAEVGSSGRSTGPHLDWRVNWFNQRLDPALLIN